MTVSSAAGCVSVWSLRVMVATTKGDEGEKKSGRYSLCTLHQTNIRTGRGGRAGERKERDTERGLTPLHEIVIK